MALCLSITAVAFKGDWPNIVQNAHEVMVVSVFPGCSKGTDRCTSSFLANNYFSLDCSIENVLSLLSFNVRPL